VTNVTRRQRLPGSSSKRPGPTLATGQREVAQPEQQKEPTMTHFISNATITLVVALYGVAVLSMFGSVMAGVLGA
jgi:hypothetical protein